MGGVVETGAPKGKILGKKKQVKERGGKKSGELAQGSSQRTMNILQKKLQKVHAEKISQVKNYN